ncbi:MAG: hypothetical protein DWI57_17285 [Chloroflexi bacterium]|nr:MAG: hypothetical protein DWI57_17285 [Chloroflexota bacterium]
MKRRACLLLFCLLLAGCQIPITLITPSAPPRVAERDQPFTLQTGQSARLPAIDLEVAFVTVLVDGRCPTGIQCAATLPVEIELTIVRTGAGVGTPLRLSAHTDNTGAVIPTAPGVVTSAAYDDNTISLLAVTPYPDVQRKPALADYRVTLLVTGGETQQPPAVTATPDSSDASANGALGGAITLAVGETARFAQEQLQLTFDKVNEDSRCPADINCFWSGIVDAQMTFARQGRPAQTFVVGGVTDRQGLVTGPVVGASGPTGWWYEGYTLELKQVLPYPARHDQPIAPADYRAVVVIAAAEKPPPPEPTADASPTPPPFPADNNGLPLLCISEIALTRLAAGASTDQPAALTPPVSQPTLVDEATGDRLCAGQFGADWHLAETSDLGAVWDDFLPDAAGYWVWDDQTEQPVQAP